VLSGSGEAASSSSVMLTLFTSLLPPASDMMIAFSPPGPTSKRSMSSGQVCVRPFSETLTSVIDPLSPEMTQSDG
jgi:hypothetical protein